LNKIRVEEVVFWETDGAKKDAILKHMGQQAILYDFTKLIYTHLYWTKILMMIPIILLREMRGERQDHIMIIFKNYLFSTNWKTIYCRK